MSSEDKDSVKFLGLLSAEEKDKILKKSDIALLNPTGKTEAAPASPLECHCYGIPVVAGGDYGAFDNMKYFPELDLKKKNIKEVINILKNKYDYICLKKRAYTLAIEKAQGNKQILNQWIKLFNKKKTIR